MAENHVNTRAKKNEVIEAGPEVFLRQCFSEDSS